MKNLAAFSDVCVYVTEPGQHNGPHGTARLKTVHTPEKKESQIQRSESERIASSNSGYFDVKSETCTGVSSACIFMH